MDYNEKLIKNKILFGYNNVNEITIEDLKKKYKKLCMENHPDNHPENKIKYTEKIKEINIAYNFLKEYAKTYSYNNTSKKEENKKEESFEEQQYRRRYEKYHKNDSFNNTYQSKNDEKYKKNNNDFSYKEEYDEIKRKYDNLYNEYKKEKQQKNYYFKKYREVEEELKKKTFYSLFNKKKNNYNNKALNVKVFHSLTIVNILLLLITILSVLFFDNYNEIIKVMGISTGIFTIGDLYFLFCIKLPKFKKRKLFSKILGICRILCLFITGLTLFGTLEIKALSIITFFWFIILWFYEIFYIIKNNKYRRFIFR